MIISVILNVSKLNKSIVLEMHLFKPKRQILYYYVFAAFVNHFYFFLVFPPLLTATYGLRAHV